MPQAEQVFRFTTSFNAFPARNLDRFLLCDVFFLGTARNIESQRSDRREEKPDCMAKVVGNIVRDSGELVRPAIRNIREVLEVDRKMGLRVLDGINEQRKTMSSITRGCLAAAIALCA